MGTFGCRSLEKGETYESNIYKEALEELGLTGVNFTAVVKLKLEEPRKSLLQLYGGVCDWPAAKFVPQPEEVEQVAWVVLKSFTQLRYTGNNSIMIFFRNRK